MTGRVLIAPDSFKGTLTSDQVAMALAAGALRAGWYAEPVAIGDGGEGTAEAVAVDLGGERVKTRVQDPFGRPVDASYWTLADGAAILDMAEASGFGRVRKEHLDPIGASTHGTGELIVAAAQKASTIFVGVGGSATTDGGAGAIQAIEDSGGLEQTRLVCLCDVITLWESAADVFAPQKGATDQQVHELTMRLAELAQTLPRDPTGVPGSGAAGGLAGGLWARFGAELVPGASYVCDLLKIDERIAAAERAISGEGMLDATTLEGKVVAELGRRCGAAGRRLDVVVGADESSPAIREELGLDCVIEAGDEAAIADAACRLLSDQVR